MYGYEKRKESRNAGLIMDMIHIIIGAMIVILAVITFLNPEGNQILLPVIFALAALLNICGGLYRFRISGRSGSRKAAACGQLVLAVFLVLVAAVSAISIWR